VQRTIAAILGAATIVAALGLSGCSDDGEDAAGPPVATPPPITAPPTVPPPPTTPGAPLPAPAALTDVMTRLADANVPGADKVGLVEYGTPADAEALDRFAKALRDNGYAPMTFDIKDLIWAQDEPGNVVANVTMKAGGPAGGSGKDLTFPMEFSPQQNSWQLTRKTADLLLQMGKVPTATPTP
jgi:hypothetical protein